MTEITKFEFDFTGIRFDPEDQTLWFTQRQIAESFGTTTQNITMHLSNIFAEEELVQDRVCKESLITAGDGKSYQTKTYALDAVIAAGYRVGSKVGTKFRQAATKYLKALLTGQAATVTTSDFRSVLEDISYLKATLAALVGDRRSVVTLTLPRVHRPSAAAKVINGAKACSRCHETKRLDEFSPQRKGAGGRYSQCRPCKSALVNARRYGFLAQIEN